MSIETFIHEIEDSKKRLIESLGKELSEKRILIQNEQDAAIKELHELYTNDAKIKSDKEYARIIEAARLQAKKILFDAINANLDSAFNTIKQEIQNYTKTPQYKKAFETMVNTAKKKLEQHIIVHCREEDHALLQGMKVTVGSTIKTLGGILAENKNGTKELDLTFEELLRTQEDKVKAFLTERTL